MGDNRKIGFRILALPFLMRKSLNATGTKVKTLKAKPFFPVVYFVSLRQAQYKPLCLKSVIPLKTVEPEFLTANPAIYHGNSRRASIHKGEYDRMGHNKVFVR